MAPETEKFQSRANSTLAALNCLPFWSIRGATRAMPDDLIVKKHRVDVTTMRVLEALASICLCSQSEAFAATYEVESSRVLLYVASGSKLGVPAGVRAHLERVWDSMKVLAAHPDSPRVRDIDNLPQPLELLHSDFIALLYRFSWPAVRQRFESVADAAIRQLDTVICDPAQFATNAVLSECNPTLSEDEHARVADLRSALITARTYILENGLRQGNHLAIHRHLGNLRVLLAGPHADEILKHLDALTGMSLSRDIRSLVWLGEPVDILRAFAHSGAFVRLCNLALDIVSISPVTVRSTVDPDIRLLSLLVEDVYTDRPLRTPEPNWESDLSTYLLAPLREQYPCIASEEAPAHPECALVAHLCTKLPLDVLRPSTQYIGTSEPCCLPCYRYVRCASALSFFGKLRIRGTDGRIPPYWVLCDIYREGGLWLDHQPSYRTAEELFNDLRDAIEVVRVRTARVRQAERMARGEPALTPEEQQYRDDVASPPVPYWMRPEFLS